VFPAHWLQVPELFTVFWEDGPGQDMVYLQGVIPATAMAANHTLPPVHLERLSP